MHYKSFFTLFLFFIVSKGFGQIAPTDLQGYLDELNYYKSSFTDVAVDARRNSNDILQDVEYSDEDIEKEKINFLNELVIAKNEFQNEVLRIRKMLESALKELVKTNPFIPRNAKILIDVYQRALNYLDAIELEFNSFSRAQQKLIQDQFAKVKMEVTLSNDGVLSEDTSYKKFLKELYSDNLFVIYSKVFNDKLQFKNQVKFMKKYKLDSLLGYYSSESTNIYIGRQHKTGKYGLFESDYSFIPKYIRVVFDPVFDSIRYDLYYGNEWGEPHWTTAIAWKDGRATVVEKEFEEPDFNNDLDPYKFKYTESKYAKIVFPDLRYKLVYGNLGVQNENGNWVIVDIDEDSIISPEYPSRMTLPGVNRKNEVLTYYQDRKKVSYHPNYRVSEYTEGNLYRRYHRNGQLMMEEIRVPSEDTYDGTIKVYTRDGIFYGKGILRDKRIVDFNVYFEQGELKRRIVFKDSVLLDTVFYPNGNIHSYGRRIQPGNTFGITIDYYDGLGVSRPIFYFNNSHFKKDSIWTYYYASGIKRAEGIYKEGKKIGKWEYYNPLGVKTSDSRYKMHHETDLIFPFRLSKGDSIPGFASKKNNQAILYDFDFNPPILELWDLERNKQLRPPFNVPLVVNYDYFGFIGKNQLVGGSLDGDVFECYDFEADTSFFPSTHDYEKLDSILKEVGNEKVYSTDTKFKTIRKLDIRKVLFENNKILIASDSGKAFQFDLSNGNVQIQPSDFSRIDLDSVTERLYQNQETYYVNYLTEDIDFFESTGGMKLTNILVKNVPKSKEIELYKHYGIGRLTFQNKEAKSALKKFVKLEINEEGDYIFYALDNYYMGSKNLKDLVFFKQGPKYFDFEQFDLKYNRPDIILDRLGYADSSLIQAYHHAYKKRLKKMGFTEEMLKDDFHIPEIKIENFEEMPTITGENQIELNLKMKDDLYNLDRINIWINDVAVYGSNGISLRNKNVKEYAQKIKLGLAKGKNKIQVSVLNQAGAESYKETIEIECTKGKAKPDLYLVTIGVSEFQQSDYNLTYAGKDAQDIAQLFEKNKVFEQVYSKVLTNQEVTKENIQKLKTFLKSADINDEVMIFIAGHGVLDEELDYYFASYDMDFQNPAEKGIPYSELEALLDGIKPLKKTLLIDACHSGEIDKEEVELIANNTKQEGDIQFRTVGKAAAPKLGMQSTSELSKSLFTDLRKGTGATVISSAGGMEFAMEGADWNNGLFTYCLLNGIRSKEADLNQDKEIWLSELQEYIQQKVFELSKGQQKPTSRIENQTVDFRVF